MYTHKHTVQPQVYTVNEMTWVCPKMMIDDSNMIHEGMGQTWGTHKRCNLAGHAQKIPEFAGLFKLLFMDYDYNY